MGGRARPRLPATHRVPARLLDGALPGHSRAHGGQLHGPRGVVGRRSGPTRSCGRTSRRAHPRRPHHGRRRRARGAHRAGPEGLRVRTTWVGAGPAQQGELPALFREAVPDQFRTGGFCASYWLTDPAAGTAVGLSFWEGPTEIRERTRIEPTTTAAVRGRAAHRGRRRGVRGDRRRLRRQRTCSRARTHHDLRRRATHELGTLLDRPPGTLLAVSGEQTEQVIVILEGTRRSSSGATCPDWVRHALRRTPDPRPAQPCAHRDGDDAGAGRRHQPAGVRRSRPVDARTGPRSWTTTPTRAAHERTRAISTSMAASRCVANVWLRLAAEKLLQAGGPPPARRAGRGPLARSRRGPRPDRRPRRGCGRCRSPPAASRTPRTTAVLLGEGGELRVLLLDGVFGGGTWRSGRSSRFSDR